MDRLASTRSSSRRADRARFLLYKLLKRARQLQVGLPPLTQTRYINTISPEQEPYFPGDEADRAADPAARSAGTRWRWSCGRTTRSPGSAATSRRTPRAASLYEVGLQPLLPGQGREGPGDQVFYQGHAAPGIYARAFLEGRLTRRPARPLPPRGRARARASAPTRTRGSCPTSGSSRRSRWASARSRDLPGPLQPLPAATAASPTRPARASGRSSATARWTSRSRSARSRSPAREGLDNLTFVVNCNLQRLDGPVRGNGKIIQELEAALPRRRLERHQGDLGPRVGRPPRPRRRRRPRRAR